MPIEHMNQVSSSHFRATLKGPWETIGRTDFRMVVDHDSRTIHVTGRGSQEEDWGDNFNFKIREPAEEWFPGVKNIKVHAGFLKQYRSVRNKLIDTAHQYSDYAIRVSGYSLGGTWTQIFVQDVLFHWPDRDIQAIFYAPANPWRKLPKKYQKALKRSIVFVRNRWDPVGWMRVLRFYRYGENITIGRWYRIFPAQHKRDQMIRALDERSEL